METSQNTRMNNKEKLKGDMPMTELKVYDVIEQFKPEQASRRYDFTIDPRQAIKISNNLQHTCYERGLIGLACPQVGLNFKIIYVRGMESALFNPVIIDQSESEIYMEELSASYPGLVIKIKRPEVIKVRWTNALGVVDVQVFSGLTSRTIQRKMDFIEGELFIDKATKYHRDLAFKKLGKLDEKSRGNQTTD